MAATCKHEWRIAYVDAQMYVKYFYFHCIHCNDIDVTVYTK